MRINTLETTPNACRPGPATEWALLALLATLWGASYTFIKIGVATIPPFTLIASRTLVAGLLLLAVLRLRGFGCLAMRRAGNVRSLHCYGW